MDRAKGVPATGRSLAQAQPIERNLNDPKRNFLLDAWVLAKLSKHKPFDQIRLADVDEQWPDGFARIESGEQKIEVTSASFQVVTWAQNIDL
jgi:hypothetical protein